MTTDSPERVSDETVRDVLDWHKNNRSPYVVQICAELLASRAEVEKLRAALEQLDQWADAYPIDVFPEPHFPTVNEVLNAAGLSLTQVSASNMRHVITGVKAVVRAALTVRE